MQHDNKVAAIGLTITWALLLFLWAIIRYSSSTTDALADFYNVFILCGGLGMVFPLLTFPVLPKKSIWKKVLVLLLSVGIYFFAFYVSAVGVDLDSNVFEVSTAIGGIVGAGLVSMIYTLFYIKRRPELYIALCTLFGGLSFWPVWREMHSKYAFIISIPLWVLSIGLLTIWAVIHNETDKDKV